MADNFRFKTLLEASGKSLYAVQKETEIGYTTLLRYRDDETTGIRFEHIRPICRALNCDPNGLFGIGKPGKFKE